METTFCHELPDVVYGMDYACMATVQSSDSVWYHDADVDTTHVAVVHYDMGSVCGWESYYTYLGETSSVDMESWCRPIVEQSVATCDVAEDYWVLLDYVFCMTHGCTAVEVDCRTDFVIASCCMAQHGSLYRFVSDCEGYPECRSVYSWKKHVESGHSWSRTFELDNVCKQEESWVSTCDEVCSCVVPDVAPD